MCGINGIILNNDIPSPKIMSQMNDAIKHRGPDDSGIFKFENCILGHRRLSIQDLSINGRQPMSVDGRYWIIYNGEIYNFKIIKQDLISLGYIFYSNTDTEVILNAYKEWGTKSFSKFNGMWCFSILDTKTKKLIISRDRYGVKPCYYYIKNKSFIFSSEIKGLSASNIDLILDEKKFLRNPKELEGYFTTIYKNVNIVPPGSVFEINLRNLNYTIKRWWNGLNNIPEISLNYKKSRENLREKLIEATKIRLISDVDIAISLSGGIDSSTIFSIINSFCNKDKVNLNPFIVKDDNLVFNNAFELTNLYKTKLELVETNSSPFENIKFKLATLELPQLYTNQLDIYKQQRKKGFNVSIDGHGADESLGGYLKDLQLFPIDHHNNIADAYKTLFNISDENNVKKIIEKFRFVNSISTFDESNFSKIFQNYNKINNQFICNDLCLFSNEPLISDYLIDDLNEMKEYPLSFQKLYFDSNFGHLQWLLNKWDKASMAQSVEIRSPFLDWNFFQFSLALPSNFKVKNGFNKSILRDSFTDIIPSSILKDATKQGLSKNLDPIKKKEFLLDLCNEENFINHNLWNGKFIKDKLDNENFLLLNENVEDLWQIAKIYCLDEGIKERKMNLVDKNFKIKFNRLNYNNVSDDAA